MAGLAALFAIAALPGAPAVAQNSEACAGANAKLEQGQLTAARDSYLKTLASNPKSTCATSGLAKVTAAQNREKKLCAEGAALDKASKSEEADARYTAALRENARSKCAEKGLEPPDEGKSFDDWIDLLPKIVAAVGALLLLLLLPLAFLRLGWTWIRRKRPSLVVDPFADGAVEPKVGGGVTSLLEERLIDLRRSAALTRGSSLDLDLVLSDVELFDEDENFAEAVGGISEVSQLQIVVALLAWADQITHKRRFAVTGDLLPSGPKGAGVALAIYQRKSAYARVALWEKTIDDWLPDGGGQGVPGGAVGGADDPPDPAPFYRLAGAAAAWTQYQIGRALDKHVDILTSSGESFALVSAGLQLHRRGEIAQAAELYARALLIDPDNVAALANLAFAFRDAGLLRPALLLIVRARVELERKHGGRA